MTRTQFSIAVCLGLCIGCAGDKIGLPSREWHAPITGTVRDPSGKPIVAAVVVLPIYLQAVGNARFGRCAGANGGILATQSDTAGRFSVSLYGTGGPNLICVVAQATALTNSGAISGVTEIDSVWVGPAQNTLDVTVMIGRNPP